MSFKVSTYFCNLDLAINALKWMLVPERPLTLEEIIAAAELNPSVDNSVLFH